MSLKLLLDKLDNEKLISGVKFSRDGNGIIPLVVFVSNLKMISKGIDYVEDKLLLDKTLSGAEKINIMTNDSANWGWEQFKDFASKTLAEIIRFQ